ncbi:MAG: glutathione S-transferase family protein [Burkholderiales bacterium]|nr:glutathione S-transferase family protein [Burkholderiales bacterium]
MKLFGSRNSRSLRCVWALEEAGASYDYQRVWMMKGEGQAPWFKEINPAGKIPVLQDGDLKLTESAAIVYYIAEKFPASGLLPDDLRLRAEVHRWTFFALTELEPHLWAIAQHRFALPEDKRVAALEPTSIWQFGRAARTIEKRLGVSPYIAGDAFTLADIVVFHCLVWATSARLDPPGEACTAYVERLRQRDAYVRATERERVEAERHEATFLVTPVAG